MSEPLPPFARQWMAQWKRAAVELPRVRAAELRQLRSSQVTDAMSLLDNTYNDAVENPYENPLVIQQRWFMRLQLLQMAKTRSSE